MLHSRIRAVAKTFQGAIVRGETTGVDRLSLSLSQSSTARWVIAMVFRELSKSSLARLSLARAHAIWPKRRNGGTKETALKRYTTTQAHAQPSQPERERKINTHTRSRLAGSLYTYIHGCVCVYGCVGKCVCVRKRGQEA